MRTLKRRERRAAGSQENAASGVGDRFLVVT